MKARNSNADLPYLTWIVSLFLLTGWAATLWPDGVGWDYKVITTAAQQVKAGIDPYLAGVALQDTLPHTGANRARAVEFIYVYPPITLPALKLFAGLPAVLRAVGYWGICYLAILLTMWVSLLLAEPGERLFLASIAPFSLLLPGWILFPTVLGGNIAFLLYGLIFGAFWLGWKRDGWLWFYAAVILASCVKMPYLVYLAVPLLCRRRKLLPVSIAATCGVGFFAAQRLIWPELFRSYMLAVNHMFTFNNDFGASPAGRFGAALEAHTSHYAAWGTAIYLMSAAVIFSLLLYLAIGYKRGLLTDEQWFPIMLTGVLLLNPRINEYDLIPVTIMMALIACRLVRAASHPRAWTAGLVCAWLGANVWAQERGTWPTTLKSFECAILLCAFAGGCALLVRQIRAAQVPTPALV